MSIIIIALIVLIIVALLCYGIDQVPQFAPFNGLLKLMIIIIGVLIILHDANLI